MDSFDITTCPQHPHHCIEPSCPACCCFIEKSRQTSEKFRKELNSLMVAMRKLTKATTSLIKPMEEIMEIEPELVPNYFIGIKWFKVIGVELISPAKSTPWPPCKKLQAMCRHGIIHTSPSPIPSCDCGIYAYTDISRAISDPYNSNTNPHYAGAIIAGWGKTILHQFGFRSQFAYPLSILRITGSLYQAGDENAKAIAETYKVPVTHRKKYNGVIDWLESEMARLEGENVANRQA